MAKASPSGKLNEYEQRAFEQFLPVALHELNTHCNGLADRLQAEGATFRLIAPHAGEVGTLYVSAGEYRAFAPSIRFGMGPIGEGWRAFFSGTDFSVQTPATLDAQPEYAALFEKNARTWLKLPAPLPTPSLAISAPTPVAALLPMSKFIVSSSALLKTLQPLAAVITNNPVVPALSNFLFEVTAGKLQVTASDLEVSVITSLPVESRANLSICVPSRLLLNLLKQLPDQPVTFDVDEDHYSLEVHTANGRYKLTGENAADFPKVPTAQGSNSLEISSPDLLRAISKTIFAVSTDELRPAMTGILLQMEPGSVTFVATDGHRLLRYRRLDVGSEYRGNVIIPRKAWALLKGTMGGEPTPVVASFSQSNASFSFHNVRLVTRLIDERYPDYENVIPISNPNKLLMNRVELLRASQRCSLMANKTTHQVRLRLAAAELTLSAEDLDFSNEAHETLACQYDGEPMDIGFNSSFLHEMLGALDNDEVTVSMSTPNRAGILEPAQQGEDENVLMLVMPVMLNNYV